MFVPEKGDDHNLRKSYKRQPLKQRRISCGSKLIATCTTIKQATEQLRNHAVTGEMGYPLCVSDRNNACCRDKK